jgi:RpiR family carbohydrate utilization transcriptional regulator
MHYNALHSALFRWWPLSASNLFQHIRTSRAALRKSERKVADYVLAHADQVIHMRIVDLAQEARVSEPTVVRFCRAIDCSGFQNFKLELARYLAHYSLETNWPPIEQFNLDEKDSAREYTFKVFDALRDTLLRVRGAIDIAAIEAAVAELAKARRVEFYGFGASSAVAIDAQHKFFRLQISSAAYSDPHIQAMSALSLSDQDVVVAISQSGRTRALLEAMTLAQQSGARVIGLAPSNTPVTQQSDISLFIDIEEESENYTPLPSRIAHMAVIDILAVGVARTKGPAINEHLRKLDRELLSLRS